MKGIGASPESFHISSVEIIGLLCIWVTDDNADATNRIAVTPKKLNEMLIKHGGIDFICTQKGAK